MQRKNIEIEEAQKSKKELNDLIKKNKEDLKKYKKLLDEAVELENKRFCKKCGLDMEENPDKRATDDVCVNCSMTEGIQ